MKDNLVEVTITAEQFSRFVVDSATAWHVARYGRDPEGEAECESAARGWAQEELAKDERGPEYRKAMERVLAALPAVH